MPISGLLACKEFDWSQWLDPEPLTESPSPSKKIADFLQEFESDYFTRKARTAKTETTFRDYLKSWDLFKDVNVPLTTETILFAVRSTPPDSDKRKRTCMAMKSLAKFARIEIDMKPYQGKYSPYAAIQERNLPSEEFIEEWRDRIPNPALKWTYSIIATYNIRSHELFYLDTSLLHEPPGISNSHLGSNCHFGKKLFKSP